MARSKTTAHDPNVARLTDTYEEIDYALLVPAEDNVRDDVNDVDDLADSIYQIGLQQPLRVVLVPIDEYGTHAYKIVAGHRRHAALGALIGKGLWDGPIPVLVAPAGLDDQERIAAMIVENIQRKDLNPVEEAHAFRRLVKEFGYKQADVAAKVGRSASYVSDRLALLTLPDEAVARVREGSLPLATASQLTQVKDTPTILRLIAKGNIPHDNEITTAVRKLKAAKLKASFVEELAARKIALHESHFPAYNTKEVAKLTDPKELDTLGKTPKGVEAWMTVRDWEGTVAVTLGVPLTEAERAKIEEQRRIEVQKEAAERDAKRAEQFQRELASMSDEKRAWVEECERLRAEHAEAVRAHIEEMTSIRRSWYDQLKAATVAGWAVSAVADMAYPPEVLSFFEVERFPDERAEDAVTRWVQADTKNLMRLCAYVLVDQLADESPKAIESYEAYMQRHSTPTPTLELPPEPGLDPAPADDDDEQLVDDNDTDPIDQIA